MPFTDADISLLEKVKAILEAILPFVVLIGAAFLAWKLTDFLTKLMAVNPILGKILYYCRCSTGNIQLLTHVE